MLQPLLLIGVLIVSVVIHENAHGWVALALGDPTAKLSGRLTLNPIKHIDPVGSVIMPAVLAFSTGTAFGYAKPVPISPHRLRGRDRSGFAIVALAGPASNFLLAFVSVVVLRTVFPPAGGGFGTRVFQVVFVVNLALAAFNLIPIPPLDGSRLLRVFLRPKGIQLLDRVEPYGFVILLLLLFVLPGPLQRVMMLIQDGLVRLLPL